MIDQTHLCGNCKYAQVAKLRNNRRVLQKLQLYEYFEEVNNESETSNELAPKRHAQA